MVDGERRDRTAFESHRRLNAVYLGGRLASASASSGLVLLPRGESVVVCSVGAGGQLSIHDELVNTSGGAITAMALSSSADRAGVATGNGFVTIWEIPVDVTSKQVSLRDLQSDADDELSAQVQGAKAVEAHQCSATARFRGFSNSSISCLAFSSNGENIAAGTPDGGLRVFEVPVGYCSHSLTVGASGGGAGVSAVLFHGLSTVFAATEEGPIYRFDTVHGTTTEMSKHARAATRLVASGDGSLLVSAGRDGILSVWRTSDSKLVKIIVTEESVESLTLCGDGARLCTAGENGGVRFWDLSRGAEVTRAAQLGDVLDVATVGGLVLAATNEGDLVCLDAGTGRLVARTLANVDEVYDICTMRDSVAVAYNSSTVRLLTPTESDIWDDVASLDAHTATVLALDVSGSFMASSSKDKTARVWKFEDDLSKTSLVCTAEGHTEAVGAVALARVRKNQKQDFFVTGAADRTLKLWSLKPAERTSALWTVLAHEKDINSVAVSPDNRLIASGSQDRTVKLWLRSEGTLSATCKGHKRGIWCLAFSPVDRVLASASGDRSIRIWNTNSGACLRTIEGQNAASLKVVFISAGLQLASSGADGIVRVWNARDGSQAAVVDAHDDRVWALATFGDGDQLVSGAANGTVRVWKDVSDRVRRETQEQAAQLAERDQEVSDAVRRGDWSAAVRGAVELSQPRRLEAIVGSILDKAGHGELERVFRELCKDESALKKLLNVCRDWNAIAGSLSIVAATQLVLRCVFSSVPLAKLAGMFGSGADRLTLDALQAHSQRHYERVKGMSASVYFLDLTRHRMRSLAALNDPNDPISRPGNSEDTRKAPSVPAGDRPPAQSAYESIEELRKRARSIASARRKRRRLRGRSEDALPLAT